MRQGSHDDTGAVLGQLSVSRHAFSVFTTCNVCVFMDNATALFLYFLRVCRIRERAPPASACRRAQPRRTHQSSSNAMAQRISHSALPYSYFDSYTAGSKTGAASLCPVVAQVRVRRLSGGVAAEHVLLRVGLHDRRGALVLMDKR